MAIQNEVKYPNLYFDIAPVGTLYMPYELQTGGNSIVSKPPKGDKWVRLKSGLTGGGAYNENKVTSESVSGSAPLITATFVIDDADSPLNGKTIHLLEDEGRFIKAGNADDTASDLENDAFQSHKLRVNNTSLGTQSTGVSGSALWNIGGENENTEIISDGSNGTPRTANNTRPRNIRSQVYLKIK